MKKNISFSFLTLGISSIIFQALIIREIISCFYGNEIFIGFILFIWLLWTAIGSKFIANLFKKTKKILIGLHYILPVIFLIQVFLLRVYPSLNTFPGEMPNILNSFLAILIILAPGCVVLGIIWTIASHISSSKQNKILNINKGYLKEMIGFVLGGILFSFIFVQLNIITTICITAIINFFVAFFLTKPKKYKTITFLIIILTTILLLSPYPTLLNKEIHSLKFPHQTIKKTISSPHGNITITNLNNQYNFYENGGLIGHTQNKEFSEILVHTTNLYQTNFNKALVIGVESSNIVQELLKYPFKKIYYIQPNKKIYSSIKAYLEPQLKNCLDNKRIEILYGDAFSILKKSNFSLDNIFVNLPNPSTALINRFYTKNFLALAYKNLNSQGILTSYLKASPSQTNKNLQKLNSSFYKSTKETFDSNLILPGNNNIFLSSPQKDKFNLNKNKLIQNFNEKNLKTSFFNENYINYRLSKNINEIRRELTSLNNSTNTFLRPIGYFLNNLFWLDHFYSSFSKNFNKISHNIWYILSILVLILFIRSFKKTKKTLYLSASIGAFSSMAFEVIILMVYQNLIGNLYYKVALLIAALTMGMVIGIWTITKLKTINFKTLKYYHFFIILTSVLITSAITFIPETSLLFQELTCIFVSLIAGFATASIFPISNKLYLKKQQNISNKTSHIYSADLVGASLGSLLPIITIPLFGAIQTLSFILTINIVIILLIYFLVIDKKN